MSQAEELAVYARDPRAGDDEMTFKTFEQSIIRRVCGVGCTAVLLFLSCCESRVRERTPRWLLKGGRTFERKSPTDRSIMTWFGSVRYWRTYMLERDAPKGGHGFFPLDHELGLTSERFGFNMLAVVVRLATTLSFATAKSTAELFLPEVPATEVVEQATLGFGRFTSEWFESVPPPDDDGDPDLARYTKLFFPKAIHTLDVIHVVERLWKASACFYEAGSEDQEKWVEEQKDLLYAGCVKEVIGELRARRNKLCRSTKNEKRRERLKKFIDYMKTRVHMMNYDELVDEDLEIGSGAVEGAVKHIIGKRCDQGGMRWIVERNEALVQLRCIEVNGDWERFTSFVHDRIRGQQLKDLSRVRIQQKEAEPLPKLVKRLKCKAAL